jgi:hypothetical protein
MIKKLAINKIIFSKPNTTRMPIKPKELKILMIIPSNFKESKFSGDLRYSHPVTTLKR